MITLDQQIYIYFANPSGINKAGAYRYEVYLTLLNKKPTLYLGWAKRNKN